MPAGDVTGMTGIVVAAGSGYAVNVAGAIAPAAWPAGYIQTVGDIVAVLRFGDLLYVIGPVSTSARPLTGTVSGAASGGLVPVDVTVGSTPLRCRYTGTAPAIGALVRLDWQATQPWVWPSAASVVPPPPIPDPDPVVPPPPPPPPESGSTPFPVIDAGSYRPGYGRWDNGTVLQWRYGSESENRGAWFLGTAPQQLAGRTITRCRFSPGARARVGSYNAALNANFWIASNPTRPGGDVARVLGPYPVTIQPGASPTVDLPAAAGQYLADHGGAVAITGSPYLGFNPGGSAITLDWTR